MDREKEMTFEKMRAEEADFVDAAAGGMDGVPEWEVEDYVGSLLIANQDKWKRPKE